MRYICSIAVVLALAGSPAFAQFYQYTDKNGNVVITDSPPSGAGAREKKVDTEGVYRSTRSAADYPDYGQKDGHKATSPGQERSKKNYNRVNVAIYMTEW
jgi:hypothetical protein